MVISKVEEEQEGGMAMEMKLGHTCHSAAS